MSFYGKKTPAQNLAEVLERQFGMERRSELYTALVEYIDEARYDLKCEIDRSGEYSPDY